MKKFIVSLLVALAGIGAWFTLCSTEAAPNVTFTSLEGKQFQTSDLQGKVVLVKFWATNCVTCIQQMPDTIAYHNKYKEQGYDPIAVAMAYDPEPFVKNYTRDNKLPFTVTLDKDGSVAKAFDDIKFTPVSFLLDRQGNIVKRYIGNYDKAIFEKTLQDTLAKT